MNHLRPHYRSREGYGRGSVWGAAFRLYNLDCRHLFNGRDADVHFDEARMGRRWNGQLQHTASSCGRARPLAAKGCSDGVGRGAEELGGSCNAIDGGAEKTAVGGGCGGELQSDQPSA
mmetsp:Transcript_70652/g.157196  ORF Transcript_70652/g.157196 Transcript_70652/m.157196 type:complete len:118 (+) Transcript_70652:109-462(+)